MESKDIKEFLNVEINNESYDDYEEKIEEYLLNCGWNYISNNDFEENLDDSFKKQDDGTYVADVHSGYSNGCFQCTEYIAFQFANGYIVLTAEAAE